MQLTNKGASIGNNNSRLFVFIIPPLDVSARHINYIHYNLDKDEYDTAFTHSINNYFRKNIACFFLATTTLAFLQQILQPGKRMMSGRRRTVDFLSAADRIRRVCKTRVLIVVAINAQ